MRGAGRGGGGGQGHERDCRGAAEQGGRLAVEFACRSKRGSSIRLQEHGRMLYNALLSILNGAHT